MFFFRNVLIFDMTFDELNKQNPEVIKCCQYFCGINKNDNISTYTKDINALTMTNLILNATHSLMIENNLLILTFSQWKTNKQYHRTDSND